MRNYTQLMSPWYSRDVPATDHIYIHVPFCDGKCHYCAFYSQHYSRSAAEAWLSALATELADRESPRAAPQTLYIGGGTPSVLDDDLLERFLDCLHGSFLLERLHEWSVEVNPGTATPARIRRLVDAGVTRISVGAQSFNGDVLETIGRRHSTGDIDAALAAARDAGSCATGIDLIAALPGVDSEQWKRTLTRALSFEPEHISVYSLTLDPGSAMTSRVEAGELTVPGADEQIAALNVAETMLGNSGYERYEISNYARPGYECRHNRSCWRGEDYLGFGPAAASRDGLTRRTNTPNLTAYVDASRSGAPCPCEIEVLSPEDDATERVMFGFRLAEGVDLDTFCQLHPHAADLRGGWENELRRLASDGLVERAGARWRLTPRGRDFADHVAEALI